MNIIPVIAFIEKNSTCIYSILVILILCVFLNIISVKILKKLHKKIINSNNIWSLSLIKATKSPIIFLIWLFGISLIGNINFIHDSLISYTWISHLLDTLYIAFFAWFSFRFINYFEKYSLSLENKGLVKDATTIIIVCKLSRIMVSIIFLLILMQIFNYSISGLIAFGGIGGIAISFAAKDLLSNFFGGLMIYMDAPFKTGDWIRAVGKPIEGTVEYIGWRQTCIRTFDRRPLYIPNSTFVNMPVENPSRMQNRRIKTAINIRYKDSDKLAVLLQELRKLIKSHPDLDQTQTTFIYFNCFGPSSLDCLLYCFTKTTNWTEWLAIQEQLFLEIIRIIHKHGADIAFPTTTIECSDNNFKWQNQ